MKTVSYKKFGYRLSINRSGIPGSRNWEPVGFIFTTTDEANEYRKSKYPDITKWTIQGVRVNTKTISTRSKEESGE